MAGISCRSSDRKKPKKYHKKPKNTEKNRKKPKNTEKNRKKPNATSNFKFGTGFFRFFSVFFGLQPPPPPLLIFALHGSKARSMHLGLNFDTLCGSLYLIIILDPSILALPLIFNYMIWSRDWRSRTGRSRTGLPGLFREEQLSSVVQICILFIRIFPWFTLFNFIVAELENLNQNCKL